MFTLKIEDNFFELIQQNYDKMKMNHNENDATKSLIKLQETSLSKTWDNDEDKAWDEL